MHDDYQQLLEHRLTVKQLTVLELKEKLAQQHALLLLDVRELAEYQYVHLANSLLMPVSEVEQRWIELDKQQSIVVLCHHGFRSHQVALYLNYLGFNDVSNLQGGLDAWAIQCDHTMPRY